MILYICSAWGQCTHGPLYWGRLARVIQGIRRSSRKAVSCQHHFGKHSGRAISLTMSGDDKRSRSRRSSPAVLAKTPSLKSRLEPGNTVVFCMKAVGAG